MEVVDVDASGAREFVIDEDEWGEICVERSWEFGEWGGEVGVEIVEDKQH